MPLSERFSCLGTETAFAVSAEAAELEATGKTIYPFHLGDINLPTPANIVEASLRAIRDRKTGYCPAAGIPKLRELVAEDINRSHGTSYSAANVSIQPGGKPVIGKFILAVMNSGDEVLYPNPGYPIYESLIGFFGGIPVPYGYREQRGRYSIDIDGIRSRITPRSRILILNDPQNPTGASCTEDELRQITGIVRESNLIVLSDEAYFDIRYSGRSISIASMPEMESRCLILYTFSKKYAMTGWRLGAAIGPEEFATAVSKLNVNQESCSNHFVQCGAVEALSGSQDAAGKILNILEERRNLTVDCLNRIGGVQCEIPEATFYLWPDVTTLTKRLGISGYEELRRTVLHETGVSFCTRLHFGKPLPGEEKMYVRFAYSGINSDGIEEGLERLKTFVSQF